MDADAFGVDVQDGTVAGHDFALGCKANHVLGDGSVIVQHSAFFAARYEGAVRVVGPVGERLDYSAEPLRLGFGERDGARQEKERESGTEGMDGVDHCLGVACSALDPCHAVGTCNHATGACDSPAKPDGTGCDDGNPSTVGDVCTGGVCAGVDHCAGVACTALDECHDVGACIDHGTGACDTPAKADGTPCSTGACQSGACTASSSSSSSSGGSDAGSTSSSSSGGLAAQGGGCDCREAGGDAPGGAWLAAVGLGLAIARRRRRDRRIANQAPCRASGACNAPDQ